jgi:hypothetical protein
MSGLFTERDGADAVTLDGSKPALRPCRYCGHLHGVLQEPKPPHGQGVRCGSCDRHLGWLPKPQPAEPDDHFDLIERG